MKRNPRYLTTGHVAKACEVSLVTVKKWIRVGKLRAFLPPGHHYRVTLEEFQRFRIEYGFPAEHEAPPRILVVDDEPEMVALVSDALRGMRPRPNVGGGLAGTRGVFKGGGFG